MKTTACKRCNTSNLFWSQNRFGKWLLNDSATGEIHLCKDDTLKPVKCKYCTANDLHWAEETQPDGHKKATLTESYGLPHACDERIAFVAAEKQGKKDAYAAEKKRIEAMPDGKCLECDGVGGNKGPIGSPYVLCSCCYGNGTVDTQRKSKMLSAARHKIWPNMPNNYGVGGFGSRRKY